MKRPKRIQKRYLCAYDRYSKEEKARFSEAVDKSIEQLKLLLIEIKLEEKQKAKRLKAKL